MNHMYLRIVRWAFARFYRELSWTYDGVAWLVSLGLWRRWVLSALPLLQGRVLEIGFGTGHIQLARAARPGPPTVGLDASPQMARRTARRLRRAGHRPRLINGVAQQLPLPDASFDTVLATFPSDYIADPRTGAEIRRVLAPGGRLVIVPLAQLDRSLYARLVDVAYRLTLQAPALRAERSGADREAPGSAAEAQISASLDRLQIAGITLERRWVPVGPSRALLLTGTRDGAGG